MKQKFKVCIISLSLAITVIIGGVVPVHANSSLSISENNLESIVIEQQLIAQINYKVANQLSTSNKITLASLSPNNWKVEYGKTKKVKFTGYASGQPTKGTRFKTGGGFYYNPEGGRNISVGVSFPLPFSKMSISASIGRSVGSAKYGEFVQVPSKKYYYKLYVEKVYAVKPYITYQKVNGKWVKYTKGSTKTLLTKDPWAKKQ